MSDTRILWLPTSEARHFGWDDGSSSRRNPSGIRVDPDTALQSTVVLACARVLAESVAGLPLHLLRRLADGGKEIAREHPLYGILHDAPNPWQTSFEWREQAMLHLCLHGNAYSEIRSGAAGAVTELWPLHPSRMKVEQIENGRLRYKYREENGAETAYTQDQIMHLRWLSDDGIHGMVPVELARDAIGLARACEIHGASFFGNGARPGVVLSTDNTISAEAAEQLRNNWERMHRGAANSSRTAVLTAGLKPIELGGNNQEAQFLEARRFQVEEVCRLYRVPPHLVGDLTRSSFCLPATETVLTDAGPVSIAEIQVGDLVWSRSDDGRMELSKVLKAGRTGHDPILTIRTTNRTIRCNAMHPILCRRPHEVAQVGRGGRVRLGGGETVNVVWKTQYVAAGELKKGDTIVTLESLPDGGTLDVCPTRVPSIGFMKFCGLLLGDGNVLKGAVTIARADTAPYMDAYRKIIQEEFTKADGSGVLVRDYWNNTSFSSVVATRELSSAGFSGTARTKSVPGWVFKLPERHRLAFIAGFLDADGSCDKKGRLSFSSCNRGMLGQIRDLCISCGIPVTNIRLQEGVTRLPSGRKIEFSQYTFTCSDPGKNKKVPTETPAYVERMAGGKPFGKKGRKYPRFGGKGFDEQGLSLARVCSIETGEAEDVFDLTVEKNHSFVAEGVVVHNSNIEQQSIDFVQHTLLPWLRRFETSIVRDLVSDPQYFAEFDTRGLLRGDAAARASYYQTLWNLGVASINEIRRWENLDPVDGGDTRFVQLNMQTLDQANAGGVVLEEPQPTDEPPILPQPEPEPEPEPEQVMSMRAMTISIDYDRTFTADPRLWGEFAKQSAAAGNRVVMVSRRPDTAENQAAMAEALGEYIEAFSDVLLVGETMKDEAAKAAGIEVDVWVDDSPQFIRAESRAAPDSISVGDFVSWGSGTGRGRGKITRIVRDGEINVPDSSFTITGTEDDPAVLITVYEELADGWVPSSVRVGHKASTLTKIGALD